MSDNTTENAGDSSLPKFMNESKIPSANIEIEERQSWLNNNLHKLMIAVSIIWFAVVLIYITQFFGWSNLFLMMPDEFGGFLAGITLPLAIIWVVMAYIDRGTSFKQEAKFLRAYMNQLVYPEDGAPQTAKAMADAIRSQVVELQQVSKLAHEQTSKIKDAIKDNVDDFAKLVGKLDVYSSQTIVELSDGVKYLMGNFENILAKAQLSAESFARLNREFIEGSNNVENSIVSLFDKITPRIKDVDNMTAVLRDITSGSAQEIEKSAATLQKFVDQTGQTFVQLKDALEYQTSSLRSVSETAIDNCNLAKTVVAKEISEMDGVLQAHGQKMENLLENCQKEIREKTDEITKTAMSNISIINNNVQSGLNSVDDRVSVQVKKIEESLAKHNSEINSFIKSLDNKAEEVGRKFVGHGEIIAQEMERLMVRSANLEDAIAMRVDSLNDVSVKAISMMNDVKDNLEDKVNTISNKIEQANSDILSYSDNLEQKAVDIEKASYDAVDRMSDLTSSINTRYNNLQNTISQGLQQLDNADKQLVSSAENIISQSQNSIESINTVASLMQKHTHSLTEASSIVVTQSQISEVSLAQQQKYITDTASRVEEIKSELKHQIDELSLASSNLERDAVNVLEMLKTNINKMLSQCNDTINKSKAINDNLANQANMFDTSANQTLAKVTHFENVLMKQTQNIEALAQNIDNHSADIQKNMNSSADKLAAVSENSISTIKNAIAEMESKSSNITDLSQTAAGYITDVASGLDDKVSALNILFRQQEADFYAYCDKVSENTNRMADILKKQISGIEEGADKLFARLAILEEDTERKSQNVVANSQKSIKELAEIESMLAEKHNQTEKMVDTAVNKLASVNEVVSKHLENFDTKVVEIKQNIGDSLQALSVGVDKVKSVHKAMVKENDNTEQKLVDQIKYMENAGIKLTSQSENIANMLNMQKNNISEVVNTLATQARLGEASIAQQYKYLTDATTDVAAKIQEINASFKNNTDGIFDTTNKMSYEFDVLGDRLLKACDAINKAAKDSVKNIDQITIRLNQCGEDLDTTIFHSVENINGVFNEYEKYLAGFNTITAETSTGVIEINNLISAQSDKMVQISEDTKKLVDCFNTVLNNTSNKLADRANDAYDKVRGLGEDLKRLGHEMDETAKLSATHMVKSSDKLRASINEIATNAERISNTILSSGDVFVKQSQALTALADGTADKVSQTITDLIEAGRAFEIQGSSIVKESIRFNDTINAQTKTLTETASKAEKVMKGLSGAYKDIKVDTFLKDAAKIISSLESVSVDINRLLNPKDEEDLWKKFYNGDTQVFIRSIAKNVNNNQIMAMRKEFEKNSELRKLVNTYMKEFETLVEKSKTHEHSAALMAVISGADLGRLYYILAKALNKLN